MSNRPYWTKGNIFLSWLQVRNLYSDKESYSEACIKHSYILFNIKELTKLLLSFSFFFSYSSLLLSFQLCLHECHHSCEMWKSHNDTYRLTLRNTKYEAPYSTCNTFQCAKIRLYTVSCTTQMLINPGLVAESTLWRCTTLGCCLRN